MESLLLIGHFDHPYMCNDGLVGCLAGHEALSRFSSGKTKLTYRMLSTVEIVGSVFYAERLAKENNVKEGLFVASSGADAPIVYQTSFKGNSVVDTEQFFYRDTEVRLAITFFLGTQKHTTI